MKIPSIVELPSLLSQHGYYPRHEDILAIATILNMAGVKAMIISGPPGVGKTFLAEVLAKILDAELIYYLTHHWTSEEDLFVKIDPARVAALASGLYQEMEEAYRPGVLLRAALLSQQKPVVLLLDEWDKAPDRVDALLLDFLQTGRVLGPFGEEYRANLSNIIVIITNNGLRDLAEPLQRRCYRYHMGFLPSNIEQQIIQQRANIPAVVAKAIVRYLQVIRENGATSPSIQEAIKLAQALQLANSVMDVVTLVRGFLIKDEADEEALRSALGKNWGSLLWGALKQARKQQKS